MPQQKPLLVAVDTNIPIDLARPRDLVQYLSHEERNDALILAEAALLDCTMLLTSDAHMLDIPPGPLRLLLEAHDVSTPLIVSPRKLVSEFFR